MKPESIEAGHAIEAALRAAAARYVDAADVVADLRKTLAREPDAASEQTTLEGRCPSAGVGDP